MLRSEFIQRASINASLVAIMERLEKFDERLRNVEDGLMLVMNRPEKPDKSRRKKEQ